MIQSIEVMVYREVRRMRLNRIVRESSVYKEMNSQSQPPYANSRDHDSLDLNPTAMEKDTLNSPTVRNASNIRCPSVAVTTSA